MSPETVVLWSLSDRTSPARLVSWDRTLHPRGRCRTFVGVRTGRGVPPNRTPTPPRCFSSHRWGEVRDLRPPLQVVALVGGGVSSVWGGGQSITVNGTARRGPVWVRKIAETSLIVVMNFSTSSVLPRSGYRRWIE